MPVRTFRAGAKVERNGQRFVNYYQQRGGDAIFREVRGKRTVPIGNWLSRALTGGPITSQAGSSSQIRVDTAWARETVPGPFFMELPNNVLYGKDVNHDVMPWFTAKRVRGLLH